ncbi:uncharacterized protein LOC117122989 [Anneissia japonica]|uniref:uncharacterized protein LOC117122989 n=1 Tax=Anneissia japonica TaxID=1529436 RepID=UPI001425A09B|nr:uncharacterized protein LOC117122989 [Anneissia japonica]
MNGFNHLMLLFIGIITVLVIPNKIKFECCSLLMFRWRFVVHGCIDGYSRAVVYLRCNTDNTSSTVLSCFKDAVGSWGLPSRVRGDMGVENRDVARCMLDHPKRGPGRSSYITGKSMRNSRIERLGRDVFQAVLSIFQDLFHDMEEDGILVPDNTLHLFCLHYVYRPRINNMLDRFVQSWNHHKQRTANNRTPIQLFISGMHHVAGEDNIIPREYFETIKEVISVFLQAIFSASVLFCLFGTKARGYRSIIVWALSLWCPLGTSHVILA